MMAESGSLLSPSLRLLLPLPLLSLYGSLEEEAGSPLLFFPLPSSPLQSLSRELGSGSHG
jgi:hypothetical protein